MDLVFGYGKEKNLICLTSVNDNQPFLFLSLVDMTHPIEEKRERFCYLYDVYHQPGSSLYTYIEEIL